MSEDIELILLEINFWKSKWLLCGIDHPPSHNDQYFFDNVGIVLDIYWSYDKIVLLDTFLYQHELHSINKNPICYKNRNNPSNTDYNCSKSFIKTDTIFTGLSNFTN